MRLYIRFHCGNGWCSFMGPCTWGGSLREFTSSWWWCCTPGAPICWKINRGHPHPFLGEFNLSTVEDLLIASVCTATACYCLRKRCAVVHVLLQINMRLDILPSKCHWVFTLSRTVRGWFNGSGRMTPAPFHLWRGVRLNHRGICWGC